SPWSWRSRGADGRRVAITSAAELDHAADAILTLHQLEPLVDLIEREAVRDERVHVDVAGQVAVDQLRHLVAASDAAERRAENPSARDQVSGDDVERLPPAGHPTHARG